MVLDHLTGMAVEQTGGEKVETTTAIGQKRLLLGSWVFRLLGRLGCELCTHQSSRGDTRVLEALTLPTKGFLFCCSGWSL